MQILVCAIEEEYFGFKIDQIQNIVFAAEVVNFPNMPEICLGAINIRDEVIPVINLRKLFQLEPKSLKYTDYFVISNVHNKKLALWIDQVKYIKNIDEAELVPSSEVMLGLQSAEYLIKESVSLSSDSEIQNKIILIYDLNKLLNKDLVIFNEYSK